MIEQEIERLHIELSCNPLIFYSLFFNSLFLRVLLYRIPTSEPKFCKTTYYSAINRIEIAKLNNNNNNNKVRYKLVYLFLVPKLFSKVSILLLFVNISFIWTENQLKTKA